MRLRVVRVAAAPHPLRTHPSGSPARSRPPTLVAVVRGWVLVVVGGPVAGVTSWWHARAGGAGTVGWLLPLVITAALVVAVVVHAMTEEDW